MGRLKLCIPMIVVLFSTSLMAADLTKTSALEQAI